MDAILKEVSALSDSDLRQGLSKAGMTVGGISRTTRKIYEKRLATHLLKERGGEEEAEKEDDAGKDAENSDVKDKETPTTQGAEIITEVKSESIAKEESANKTGDHASKTEASTANTLRAEKVGTGSTTASSANTDIYYVVCIPPEETSTPGDNTADWSVTSKISQNKKEVLKLMKENTEARFKMFKSLEEAESFAKLQTNLTTPKKSNQTSSSSQQPAVSEKGNTYRTPKPQQLVILKSAIEKKDVEKFKALVWSNPRYLVTSSDAPTFLHEGFRYNALHVAAMKNLPDMMALILDTLENEELPRMLYPNDSEESVAERWEFVTHLYLNSPEKGNGETPLHFASKFGFLDCLKLLLDHPKCNKRMANKYGLKASEIICNRYNKGDKSEVQKAIAGLLDDHFYIPVWRADDNSLSPVIGEPWSPDVPNSQSALLSQQVKGSPIESSVTLRALAGPMSPSDATEFQREWKTPPSSSKKMSAKIRRGDSEKGLERIGREMAHGRKVAWVEYWSFLDEFVDLSTEQGLQMLEDYLADKYRHMADSPMDGPERSPDKTVPPPLSVMKNLAVEFSTTSPPKQGDTNGKDSIEVIDQTTEKAIDSVVHEANKQHGVLETVHGDDKGNVKSSKSETPMVQHDSEQGTSADMEISHSQDVSPRHSSKSNSEKLETKSSVDLTSNLQRLSLSCREKGKGDINSHKQTIGMPQEKSQFDDEAEKRTNASGDPGMIVAKEHLGGQTCKESCVVDPDRLKTLDRTGGVIGSLESRETLDLTTCPSVSLSRPVKNSTQAGTSGLGSREGSCQIASDPGVSSSSKSQDSGSPHQTKESNSSRSALFSPVQMITSMMAKLHIAGGRKGKTVCEESDVDTGSSVPSTAGDDVPRNATVPSRAAVEFVEESSSRTGEGGSTDGGLLEAASKDLGSANSSRIGGDPLPEEDIVKIQETVTTPSRTSMSDPSSQDPEQGVEEKTAKTDKSQQQIRTEEKSLDHEPASSSRILTENAQHVPLTVAVGTDERVTSTSKENGEFEVVSPKTPEDACKDGQGFFTPVNQRIMATPTSSSSSVGRSTDPGEIYISGTTPTKLDLHVLRAIERAEINDNFPLVMRWKRDMEGIPEETRQRWRTPVHARRAGSSPTHHPHHQTPSPSPHRRHPSPLIGGRSPVLQRLRTWSEPVNPRGAGPQRTAPGMHDRGSSPTGGGVGRGRVPRQNLMASAYVL